ncbi:DEAD/DEAH box helicase [Cyanobium sp.]|nr:DEAD/DEAH box helicase [Cyanobium sp.]
MTSGLGALDWHGHALQLLPQRALWDPQQRLLLVADVHLGKAESFQASGVPLPSDGDLTNLNRLLELAQHHHPTAVVVLGDLIHGPLGLTLALRHKLAALPELLGCPLRLVGGNHERGSWIEGLAAEPAQRAGPLWLSHEPCTAPDPSLLTVCGHVHPVALLGQGADRLRLPCFALDRRQRQLLLPAFGDLTGGHPCPPALERWGIADGQVLPLP